MAKMIFWSKAIIIAVILLLDYALFNLFIIKSTSTPGTLIRYKMITQELADETVKVKTSKYILMYTEYYYPYDKWNLGAETIFEERLKTLNCPYTNCVFTVNKTLLSNVHDYDALVFHSARNWNRTNGPATRSPHQVYVSASKESPAHMYTDLNPDREFFNLTFTYRLDADIQWLYGRIEDKLARVRIAPAVKVDWKQPDSDFQDRSILELIKKKTSTAAWFVSHCKTYSKREILVKQLQNYTDVDVYGGCGPLKCRINTFGCDQMLNTTYRFYLAFENSLCVDYLTEKLYLNMQHIVIPVVYSGVELSRFLPPKSYIDANEFETVVDLANYLNFLGKNPEEYVKYFWWRKHYKIVPQIEITSDHLCDICKKLNEPNFSTKRQIYGDIKQWFYKDSCSEPKIKF